MTQGTRHNARCTVLIPVIGIRYSVFCVVTVTVTVTGTGTGTGTGRRSGHAHSHSGTYVGSIEFEPARCSVFCVLCSVLYALCSVLSVLCVPVQLRACSSGSGSGSLDCRFSISRWSMVRWSMVDGRFSILDSRISNSHLTVCLTLTDYSDRLTGRDKSWKGISRPSPH